MQETEKDFETPPPFVVGNEHIQEMNPAELPQNFDIEVARKSWASAPNEHIDQAIRNLHDYGFDVQSIIIKEAENRFGKEYVTNMIDSTQPDQCPKSYGGIGRLWYFLGMIGISFLGAMVDVAIREEGVESADIRYILVLVLSFILVVNRLHNIGRSGWWSVLIIVPIANLYVGVICLLLPEGYDDTKKLDTSAKIIAGILIGFIVLMIGIVYWFY